MGYRTRTQMRDEVLEQFGEAAGFITPANVEQWLREGYELFAQEALCLIDYKAIDVIDNTAILPSGFIELLELDTGMSYFPTSSFTLGTGIISFRAGFNFAGLAPSTPPDQVNIRYVTLPTYDPSCTFVQLTDATSKTALSETGDTSIMKWALGMCFEKDERENEATKAQNFFHIKAAEEKLRTAPLRRRKPLITSAWTGRARPNSGV